MMYGPNFHVAYAELFKIRKNIHSLCGTTLNMRVSQMKTLNIFYLVIY
jgi:hypothetical protein